jgi:hypothetical protein
MSIGTGIFLAALGISKAKDTAWNMECMSKPSYKTPNGYDVYVDGHLREYINGEYIVTRLDVDEQGKHHYKKVYYDSFNDNLIKERVADKRALEFAKQLAEDFKGADEAHDGKVYACEEYYAPIGQRVPIELSTGKPYHIGTITVFDKRHGKKIDEKYVIGYYSHMGRLGVMEGDFYEKKEISRIYYKQLDIRDAKCPFLDSIEYENE